MKHKRIAMTLMCFILFVFMGCGGQQNELLGTYVSVGQPQDEAQTQKLVFEKDLLIMSSATASTKVHYTLTDRKLKLESDFGVFSYDFTKRGDTVVIDGQEYLKTN